MAVAKAGSRDIASYRGALAEWWITGRLPIRLQATLLGLLCFSAVVVPRLLPALWGVLALLAAVHVFAIDPKRPLALLRTPIGVALGMFVAYLFVNATWAPDPSASFVKAATVLGLAAGAFLIAASFSLLAVDDARLLARSALLGLMPGVAFLLIEIAFDEPITRFISNHIAHVFALRKKAHVEGGEVTKIAAFILNRNATSFVLLLIPFLLFMGALATARRSLVGFVALLVAAAICVLLSQSGTSIMAFFVGALVLGLAAVSLKVTRALLVVGGPPPRSSPSRLARCPTISAGSIGRGCRRKALPRASTSGSTLPTKSRSGRSPALVSVARAPST